VSRGVSPLRKVQYTFNNPTRVYHHTIARCTRGASTCASVRALTESHASRACGPFIKLLVRPLLLYCKVRTHRTFESRKSNVDRKTTRTLHLSHIRQSSPSSLSSKSMTVALELPDCREQLPAAGRPPPTGTAGSGPGSGAGACPAASRPPRLGAIAKSSSSLSSSLGSRRCCLVGLALGAALAALGAAAALRLGAWLGFRAGVSGQVQAQGPGPGPGQGPVLSGAC